MARSTSWWRKVGIALAALVLTVFTLGPGLDGLLCRDGGSLSAVAAEAMPVPVVSSDGQVDPADEGPGICVHGHCHHAAPYVPTSLAGAVTPLDLAGVVHALPRARVPTSDPKFGLMRPPRA